MVGIVTELDLIRAVLRAGKALETTLAQDIMTRDVTTVDAETPMEEVMRVLEETFQQVAKLPRATWPEGRSRSNCTWIS